MAGVRQRPVCVRCRRRAHGDDDRRLCGLAAVLSGRNIGSLAVHGTVNDIAMAGARPLYLSASFIIEEGLRLSDLKMIADSMGEAARAAGVYIITGDTKVVERGRPTACSSRPPGSVSCLPDSTSLPGMPASAIVS